MAEGQLKRELVGVVLLVLALFLAATILFGGAAPEAGTSPTAHGLMGPVGSWLHDWMLRALGVPATMLLPLVPAVHALRLFGRMRSDTDRSWMLFLAGLVALVPIACALAVEQGERAVSAADGLWGSFVAYYLYAFFGPVGAWLVVSMLLCALTVLTLAWNPIRVLIGVRVQHVEVFEPVAAEGRAKRRKKRKGVDAVEVPAALLEPPPEEMPQIDPTLMQDSATDITDEGGRGRRKKKSRAELSVEHDERIAAAIDAHEQNALAADELPPPDLLPPAVPRNTELGKKELDAMGVKLIDALRTFRVEAEITGRTTGPVVTQFEVEPAPGVKVRQIANLANDLALAMRAASIRIVAPIPGRGAVGVEVPNPSSEIVAFRELLESPEFKNARAALPIALGKDLEGQPVIADLAKMPHLLIAGATGSGKSVCVNTVITSLVYRHTPKTLRFLMVDPKMVELSVYNTLPHLRHKVITDSRDAASVLKWAEMEMQERYELLAANGCRNIQDFNRRLQNGDTLKLPTRKDVAFEDTTYRGESLPYIVVVIDELADLMMTVQGEVEPPLARLAQKARAIGIHLLLATQRPSVNVITGLIKANFPSRIAFRVASQVDSRTIIDGMGAESLLGNGDMLFIPPGKSEAARLQGAYISSEDTEALMGWYEARKAERRRVLEAEGLIVEEPVSHEPDILEEMRKREAATTGDAVDAEIAGERDKLFREAAEVVVQNQLGSTSLLQRRLKVGYGRAARIIDQLQEAGILGPADGSKARDVLVGLDDIDRICGPAS
ncbi:MAG TPA: DNA translocase FtsK 4TM domain-containing protein [Gemmatimonadaceae bacterium]|nr:DNA translocase FtsK 4TM domain-containing protein [Gemmatimonadaceae bacterium]